MVFFSRIVRSCDSYIVAHLYRMGWIDLPRFVILYVADTTLDVQYVNDGSEVDILCLVITRGPIFFDGQLKFRLSLLGL
jgi:hypothetical protein